MQNKESNMNESFMDTMKTFMTTVTTAVQLMQTMVDAAMKTNNMQKPSTTVEAEVHQFTDLPSTSPHHSIRRPQNEAQEHDAARVRHIPTQVVKTQ